ncbi:hypothetical protein PARPLA_00957 [Rhodobacteraceae bacterium THAF1]|nr:DUF1285 domain-containing protein [Palleronia sp. THAF1]QFU07493.1 hypothetical protein FIU81_02260 [Palleronia sp. THAF1]VDC20444.1 hypothetical protein PARPLA_00957 [Rhodobacteraceae bacterium THAF1]
MAVIPDAKALEEAVRAASQGGMPPIEAWDPPESGDMDLRIDRDGTWIHEGSPIRRTKLVRLFSTILKREGDAYFLVTPVEKWRITVEDAPFVAYDVTQQDDALIFTTNVGDTVTADANHPIRVARNGEEPSPYVMVRDGLEALIDRKSFYRLVDMGHVQGDQFGVTSKGVFFPMAPAEDAQP